MPGGGPTTRATPSTLILLSQRADFTFVLVLLFVSWISGNRWLAALCLVFLGYFITNCIKEHNRRRGYAVSSAPDPSSGSSSRSKDISFFTTVARTWLDPRRCVVKNLPPYSYKMYTVGVEIKFSIETFDNGGRPYIEKTDSIVVQINGETTIIANVDFIQDGKYQVFFEARKAGYYNVVVRVGTGEVTGSPFRIRIHPGPMDPTKSIVRGAGGGTSLPTLVSQPTFVQIEPFDSFENRITATNDIDSLLFKLKYEKEREDEEEKGTKKKSGMPPSIKGKAYRKIKKSTAFLSTDKLEETKREKRKKAKGKENATDDDHDGEQREGKPSSGSLSHREKSSSRRKGTIKRHKTFVKAHIDNVSLMDDGTILVHFTPNKPGILHYVLSYARCAFSMLSQPGRDIIVLTEEQKALMDEYVGNNRALIKATLSGYGKVYVLLTPGQLAVQTYYFGIIPKKLHTSRVCRTVSMKSDRTKHSEKLSITLVPSLEEVELDFLGNRSVFCGLFRTFLSNKIGIASDVFVDRREFFNKELRAVHNSSKFLYMSVRRDDIIGSSWNAVHDFSTAKWRSQFRVTFAGEEGSDAGGLEREWFTVLSKALFDPKNGLFGPLSGEENGLIHPLHSESGNYDYYKLAGLLVGKALYDTAVGRPHLITAHFTVSFYKQMLGIKPLYTDFETDDPQSWRSKISYILENDPEDLMLSFTEPMYSGTTLVREHELKKNGSRIEVTEENKMEYITLSADFKLRKNVKKEIAAFMKGLYTVIPDDLLSIFDNQELELLCCGLPEIQLDEFKENTQYSGGYRSTDEVINWFWVAVENMTNGERARLLQFITGSSQLPVGGFADLSHQITIVQVASDPSRLPMAHTCFNRLDLPVYSSYKQLSDKLHVAITDGAEGFGFS